MVEFWFCWHKNLPLLKVLQPEDIIIINLTMSMEKLIMAFCEISETMSWKGFYVCHISQILDRATSLKTLRLFLSVTIDYADFQTVILNEIYISAKGACCLFSYYILSMFFYSTAIAVKYISPKKFLAFLACFQACIFIQTMPHAK